VLAVASWFGNAAAPLWGTTGGGIALCARVYLCGCTCVPLLQELPLLPPTVASLLGGCYFQLYQHGPAATLPFPAGFDGLPVVVATAEAAAEAAVGATAVTVCIGCNWCAGCGGCGGGCSWCSCGDCSGGCSLLLGHVTTQLLLQHVLLRVCVLLRAHVLLLVCLTGTAKNGVSHFVAAGVVAVVLQGWAPRSLLVYCWYRWGNAAILGA
jgi:hypothetical protein